jgi:hypothetical protein
MTSLTILETPNFKEIPEDERINDEYVEEK